MLYTTCHHLKSHCLPSFHDATHPGQNLGIANDNDAIPKGKEIQINNSATWNFSSKLNFHNNRLKTKGKTYFARVKATFRRLGSFKKPMPCEQIGKMKRKRVTQRNMPQTIHIWADQDICGGYWQDVCCHEFSKTSGTRFSKVRKTFRAEKPFLKIQSACFWKLFFYYDFEIRKGKLLQNFMPGNDFVFTIRGKLWHPK